MGASALSKAPDIAMNTISEAITPNVEDDIKRIESAFDFRNNNTTNTTTDIAYKKEFSNALRTDTTFNNINNSGASRIQAFENLLQQHHDNNTYNQFNTIANTQDKGLKILDYLKNETENTSAINTNTIIEHIINPKLEAIKTEKNDTKKKQLEAEFKKLVNDYNL